MTGEEGKCGVGTGTGGGAGGGNTNTNVTDNANNINANVHANVNANINVSQQNGGPEKAPVVGGTNVETLPRAGKQAMKRVSRVAPLMHPYFAYCLLLCERDFYCQQHHKLGLLNRHKLPGQYAPEGQLGPPSLENYVSSLIPLLMRRRQR